MKSLVAVVSGLVLLGVTVDADAVLLEYHSSDFNDDPSIAGWSVNTQDYLAADGWEYTIFGTNVAEARSDNVSPDDAGATSPHALRVGNRAHWKLESDTSNTPTGGASAQEVVTFWFNIVEDFRIPQTGGVFHRIGDWEDTQPDFGYLGAGVGFYIQNKPAEGIRIQDGDGNQIFNSWYPTPGDWYEVVTEFNVPAYNFSLVVNDAGGNSVLSHAGPIREWNHTLTEVDGFTADVYGRFPTHAGWWDNFKFDSVPEPTTMSLLALGGLTLIRRRR